jgi:ankyrin repeat protein
MYSIFSNIPLFPFSANDFLRAQYYLKWKGNPNTLDLDGRSCLFWASMVGNNQLLHLLMESGGDISCLDRGGWSCLHASCIQGNMEIVKSLLSRGVEINGRDLQGITPLLWATRKRNEKIVSLLLDEGKSSHTLSLSFFSLTLKFSS